MGFLLERTCSVLMLGKHHKRELVPYPGWRSVFLLAQQLASE
jgi:hypothetical protein